MYVPYAKIDLVNEYADLLFKTCEVTSIPVRVRVPLPVLHRIRTSILLIRDRSTKTPSVRIRIRTRISRTSIAQRYRVIIVMMRGKGGIRFVNGFLVAKTPFLGVAEI